MTPARTHRTLNGFPRWRRRRLPRLLAVLATFAVLVGAPGGATAATPPAAGPPTGVQRDHVPDDPGARVVTLITGDRISVTGGDRPTATVVEIASGTKVFTTVRAGTGLYVIPDQAMPLLASGLLDRRLFDVAGLLAQGYDDAATGTVGIIVESGSAAFAGRPAPAGTTVTGRLPGLRTTAMDLDKKQTAGFWRELVDSGSRRSASGIDHVWLDARVTADLDRSVAQIGAPAAWERGFRGDGVTVAVLDSGIDTAHPDLADRVAASQNFTEEPDTDDHVGHGTHVASIVAGTGAASDGKYVGVADGARLLNGKVLELGYTGIGVPTAVGRESWILAGMQWAVERGADVVNMSLGNSSSDGNDPLSRAVDTLTQQSGTLFVVAAGNEGPGHYSVGGPASADSALAVGSVDRDEQISLFSSRGPRMIDGRIKPDVTAPGQEIVAARAANGRVGWPQVGERYTTLSGTSMAAPHVAGAAALLLQEHPEWTAERLRAVLTSTASFRADTDVYSQGGGRIDVDRATAQQVYADAGVLDLGYFPQGSPTTGATGKITYRNESDSPVTLQLSATAAQQSGAPAPEGTLGVSPSVLTVPAGGSAAADVTVELAGRPAGAYSGRVVASGPGGVQVGTSVGFVEQGAEVQATFRAVDADGRPAAADLVMQDPRRPNSILIVQVPAGGTSTVQVEAGDFAIFGYVVTPESSGGGTGELTVVADPELELQQPNPTIVYDARGGQPYGVRVPRDVDISGLTMGLQTERPGLSFPLQMSLLFARGPANGTVPAVPMSVLPFDPPRRGHGDLDSYWNLVSPRARAQVIAPKAFSLPVALMDGSGRLNGTTTAPLIDVGDGAEADYRGLDVAGKVVLSRQSEAITFTEQAALAQQAGARALLISAAGPGSFFGRADGDLPVLAVGERDGERLRSLSGVRLRLSGSIASSYLYDLAFREHDRVRPTTVYSPGPLAELQVAYHATETRDLQRFWQRRFPDRSSVCGFCALLARDGEDWNGGVTRTEYVTPGLLWQEPLLQDGWVQWTAARSYRPGITATSWAKAPVVPGVPLQLGALSVRDGDRLHLQLASYTDAEPSHLYFAPNWWFRGSATLTSDGRVLADCAAEKLLECSADVPSTEGTYRLVVDDRAPSFSVAVQASKSTWTFHSRRGEPSLPLLDVDYDLPSSPANTLTAGATALLHFAFGRQAGSSGGAIRPPTVELTFDGGRSWRPQTLVSPGPGRAQVGVRIPALAATDGYLGLRVAVRDAAGNSLVQEIPHAVSLTSG